MAYNAMFVRWNRPVPGREPAAIETFQGFMGYLKSQQDSGAIEGFEPVLLAAHGGDLNGFVVVRGSESQLEKLRAEENFTEWVTRAVINVDRFGVIAGWRGNELTAQMQRYGRIASGG